MSPLHRTLTTESGRVFFAMPYGSKRPADGGEPFDFDNLYQKVFVRAAQQCGLTEERADRLFGTTVGVLDAVWEGIQRAEIVVIDFTTRSADVALEFGWAMALGKRMVVLTQSRDDIPTDVKGRIRPLVYSMDDGMGGVELLEDLKHELQTVREQPHPPENTLVPMSNDPSTVLRPAIVIDVVSDHAVVDTGERGHRYLELGCRDVTYLKVVKDMTKVVRKGQTLNGAIITDMHGEVRYSLLPEKRNPWPDIVADFREGQIIRTRVAGFAAGTGAFAEIAGGVNGLILGSKDRGAEFAAGAEVEAEVLKVEIEKRQVTLGIPKFAPVPVRLEYPQPGTRLTGRVAVAKPEGRGGFILLRLSGNQSWPNAMLHCTRMGEDLRHDLNNDCVDIGEDIDVKVVRVDQGRGRIEVEEIPEHAESDAGLQAAA